MFNKQVNNWLRSLMAIALPPLLILSAGIFFIFSQKKDLVLTEFKNRSANILEKLSRVADTQKYICLEINEIFDGSKNVTDLKNSINKFASQHDLSFNFLVWNNRGNVYYSNFDHSSVKGDLQQAYFDMVDFYERKYRAEDQIPLNVYKNLRIVFGPHFLPRYAKMCYARSSPVFNYPDSSQNKPLLWIKADKKFGLACFFDYDAPDSYAGVFKTYKDLDSQAFKIAVIKDNEIFCEPEIEKLLRKHKDELSKSFKDIVALQDYFVVSLFIDHNLTGLCFFKKDEVSQINFPAWMWLLCLLGVLLILLSCFMSYRIMVNGRQIGVSIRKQLVLLFILSNALPAFVISVVSWDYLQQYRQFLLSKAYNNGLAYLQSIDELYINELTWQKQQLQKGFKKLIPALSQKGIKPDSIQEFVASFKPEPYRMFLVGSNTPFVANHEAVLKNNKVVEVFDDDFNRASHKKKQLLAFKKIAKYFLALLNHQEIDAKSGTEVEMLAEALFQQAPIQFMQEFLAENNKFWKWGIGYHLHPAIVKLIQLKSGNTYDYVFINLWDSDELQLNFMQRSYDNFSRNSQNVRVLAVNDIFSRALPPELFENEKLKSFAENVQERSARELTFVNWKGKKHLLMGLKCNELFHFRLLGLYPIEIVDRKIQRELNLLLVFGLVSFLVTLSLGLFVSSSVLSPLEPLQQGINALKGRKFSYRLPNLGKDEFGQLAEVFNTVLIDFEEIQKAAQVKEKLAEPVDKAVRVGPYLVFAKTETIIEMSGDFLEFKEFGENKVAITLADVPGSQVSSILILAFLKSALMQFEQFRSQPERLFKELNDLLKNSSRERSRKAVSAQYLLIDKAIKEIGLVSAGMFYPIVIGDNSLREIKVSAPPLGLKKHSYKSENVVVKQGEFLILFTNGVMAGGKISQGEIMDLLQRADKRSVESLYESFFKLYYTQYKNIEFVDDISMVILLNKPGSDKE